MKIAITIFFSALSLSLWAPWPSGPQGEEFWWMLLKTYAIFGMIGPPYIFFVLLSNLLIDKVIGQIGHTWRNHK